jgi:hypothetical protein
MLKQKRKQIIDYIKAHRDFLAYNTQALDIYEGNLLPYVDSILKSSLSANYYHSIKDRILPINILQRYVDKVSTTYSKPPVRSSQIEASNEFVEFYSKTFNINNSGSVADVYSNLFKGFAWEPYIDKNGVPALRELPFNSFLVMSDSMVNPEEETIFIKFMGKVAQDEDSMLVFVYTDQEFDAFYLNGMEASEYMVENEGINVIGTIPFVYGKRQKNRLIPVLDSDMLSIAKALPVMMTDAAGAQMYQSFSIIYGVDIQIENAKMSPNALWSIKSDRESDKNPQLGVLNPSADTDKIVSFITTTFSLWLETKGVRVGSVGQVDGTNLSSGISKIIDEMDVWELKKKSQYWFKKDEEELWNVKLPKIHNYWIRSGLLNPSMLPPMMPEEQDPEIYVEFEAPKPMISRSEEIAQIKAELELGTMTLEQAIRKLHPDMDDEMVVQTAQNRALI